MGDGADLALSQWDPFIDGPHPMDDFMEDEWSDGWGGYEPETPRIRLLRYMEVPAQTEKAWLLSTAEGLQVWIPKSKCYLQPEKSWAVIPEWLMCKEPLLTAYRTQKREQKARNASV